MAQMLTERYRERLHGVLCCYDRPVRAPDVPEPLPVRRLVQAGAVPMKWLAVQAEWQRDWARESTVPALAEILAAHGGTSGVAFAWKTDLLAT